MVIITYNGVNPFSGIAPTPTISRSLSPVGGLERHGLSQDFTLKGVITGLCETDFSGAWNKFSTLYNNFSQNFGNLKIIETGFAGGVLEYIETFSGEYIELFGGGFLETINSNSTSGFVVYDAPYTTIRNISIEENHWSHLLPFEIQLSVQESGLYNKNFGVYDVTNKIDYKNNKDCTISMIHSLSAKGVNTSRSALDNAKLYISQNSGWSSQVLPHFLNSPSGLILKSIQESCNRLYGEAKLDLEYVYDPYNKIGNTGVLKYTTDLNQQNSVISVGVKGEIDGGKTSSMENLRLAFSSYDFHSVANNYYQEYYTGSISTTPASMTITENPNLNFLSFDLTYNNKNSTGIYIEDNNKISVDYQSDYYCVGHGGKIKSDFSCSSNLWAAVSNFYSGYDVSGKIESLWNSYFPNQEISWIPTTKRYSEDRDKNEIDFYIEFCNRYKQSDGCLRNFDFGISIQPSIEQYFPVKILNKSGLYVVWDGGYLNRASFTINGGTNYSPCCSKEKAINETKTKINQIAAEYFVGARKVLQSQSIEAGEGNTISFSASWTAEGEEIRFS